MLPRRLHNWIRARLKRHLERVALRHADGRVATGPFAGMRYVERAFCSQLIPKLVGCYEQELFPVLEEIRVLRPRCIVDVGAAEGYYAVGLLHAGFCERVHAFELDAGSRALIGQLREKNGIAPARLTIAAACDLAALNTALAETRAEVVIMDVEGFETILVEPLRVAALAHVHLLVEIHEFVLPQLSAILTERMSPTHNVVRIDAQPRGSAALPTGHALRRYPEALVRIAVHEERPPGMHWLWMKPRALDRA